MSNLKIYPPVLIYICLSLIQIILDMFKQLYNTAFMKLIIVIMISFLLTVLCMNDYCIISWIIVFIPFILMSIITSMLLYIFGLNIGYGISNSSKIVINTPTIVNTKSSSKQIPVGSSDPEYRT